MRASFALLFAFVLLVTGCSSPRQEDSPSSTVQQAVMITIGGAPGPSFDMATPMLGQTLLVPAAETFLRRVSFHLDAGGMQFATSVYEWNAATSTVGALLATAPQNGTNGVADYDLVVDKPTTANAQVLAIVSCAACGTGTFYTSGAYADGDSWRPGAGGLDDTWAQNTGVDLALTATFLVPTTTTLAIDPANPVYRQPITLTATVANGTGGTVTFRDENATLLGTATVGGAGETATTTTTLPVGGPHTITASFARAGWRSSTGTANVSVGKATTKLTAPTSSKPTSTVGEAVTFGTKVTSESWTGTPSGTVTFFVDGTNVGTAALDGSGNASLQTSAGLTSNQEHQVTAQYTSGDASFLPSAVSAPTVQTVRQDTVNVAVASSENPTTYGKNVTYTATVTAGSGASGAPAGTVEITDGAQLLGTGALVNGTFSVAQTAPVGGRHGIQATFFSTNVNQQGGSGTLNQDVNPGATTVTITPPASKPYGDAIALVATIAGPAGATAAPLGRVTFRIDGVDDGSVDLTPGMRGVVTYAPRTVLDSGTHPVLVTYDPSVAPDANYAGSSGNASQVVTGARTTMTLRPSSSPANLGESVTLTATLSAPDNVLLTPTGGRVYFYDDNVALGDVAVSTGGIATLDRAFATAATHPLTAVFTPSGRANYLTSSAALSLVVRQLDSRVTLATSGTPSTYGGNVTFTTTVATRAPGGATPTGQVTLVDDTTQQQLGRGPLVNGVFTVTTNALGGGNHTITATYGGDATYAAGNTALVTQVVSPARPTVAVAAAPGSGVYGQTITVTATVSSTAPAARTGNVLFTDGAATLQTVRLDAQSRASFTIATLAARSHTITASYEGDANYDNATGTSAAIGIDRGTTSTELVSSSTPSLIGTSVTFTATVRALAPSTGVPPGSVVFRDGSTVIATVPLDANGVAIFATAALAAGQHTMSATYGGSTNYVGSSGTFNQRVNTEAATISLSATPKPAPPHGEPVTLTATLSGKLQTPTGAMLFKEGPSSLGAGPLAAGVASFETRSLSAGNHTVTAAYSGDLTYAVGTGAVAVAIAKQATTTTVSAGDGPARAGTPVTLRAVVGSPSTGFTGQVQFMDAQTTLGFGVLDGTAATLIVNGLTVGDHAITAVYGGDDNFTSSTAAPLVLAVGSGIDVGDADAGTGASKPSGDDGGCRTSGGSVPVATTGLALVGLALVRRRRRR